MAVIKLDEKNVDEIIDLLVEEKTRLAEINQNIETLKKVLRDRLKPKDNEVYKPKMETKDV